jgi:hypothetical protein
MRDKDMRAQDDQPTAAASPRRRRWTGALAIACAALLGACAQLPPAATQPDTIARLRLIGEQRLPWHQQFQGSTVGGLSGIDYDRAHGDWVMVSDDRSKLGPSRYYRARLDYDLNAFRGVALTAVTPLLQEDGGVYLADAEFRKRPGVVADLEALRVDPQDGSIWYASEGNVGLGLKPFVRRAAPDGRYLAELPLPALFDVDARHQSGPRDNQSFEGLSFAPDGKSLWVSLEGPLYQDGAAPTPATGAVNRISHFARDGKVLGQFAYPLDAIPATPGKGRNADNGISEILALGAHRLLVMERAGVQDDAGAYKVYVRIYEVDTSAATDIQQLPTLRDAHYRMASKRLVLDLNTLALPTLDNLEGMALGPMLANGHASLVLVSDDNFSKTQVTQLLVFEIIP